MLSGPFRAPARGLRVWAARVACWLLLGLAGGAAAQPSALALADRAYGPKALLPVSAVLRDAQGTLSFDDVRSGDAAGGWRPLTQLFGAGYVDDVYWLRLRVSRGEDAPARWWLQLDPPYLDDVRLYHVRPDGTAAPPRQAGDRTPPAATFEHRSPTFALDLAPGTHLLYLRVHTTSSLSLLPSLMPDRAVMHAWLGEYLRLGAFSGAAGSIVVASLFAASLLRQRIYALFALFVACSAMQWFTINGLARQFLFTDHPLLADRLVSSLIAVTCAAGLVFFAHLFGYRDRHRWLYRVNLASAAYMGVAAVAPFLRDVGNPAPGVGALILVNLLLMIVPLARRWRDGGNALRVGVLAFAVYALLVMSNVASVMGFTPPSEFALQGAQIGNLVLLFLLLLAVFMRALHAEQGRKQAETDAARARAEHERERLAREEQADLLSMIAHEIRTPVAVIDAALQSLQVLDEAVTPERALRHERIARAVERMSSLMELSLARERLEVARWTQDVAMVDLVALTRGIVESLGPGAAQRVRLQVDGTPCEVQADERMLRFALLNLLDNALKYSPLSMPVGVRIAQAAHDGRTGCRWTVEDRGRGIPAGDHERIFQKYFRSHEVSEKPGLGLGLYLVRQIVQRHRGWVRAVPRPPGEGACLECWLPCRSQEPAA